MPDLSGGSVLYFSGFLSWIFVVFNGRHSTLGIFDGRFWYTDDQEYFFILS